MIVFAWLGWGLSRDEHALAPVVALHRGVQGKADLLHTGNSREVQVQLAVECFELVGFVAGHLRVNVEDVAISSVKPEVLMLHVAKASRQQSGRTKQDQRKSGLHHDQRFLPPTRMI